MKPVFGFGLFLECHLSANLPVLAQCWISLLPENVQKTKGFLTFSGSREIQHWANMGLCSHCFRITKVNYGSDNTPGITYYHRETRQQNIS